MTFTSSATTQKTPAHSLPVPSTHEQTLHPTTANDRTQSPVYDVPDPSKPKIWKLMFSLTWPDKSSPVPRDPNEIQQERMDWVEKLAELLRSAYLVTAPSATF